MKFNLNLLVLISLFISCTQINLTRKTFSNTVKDSTLAKGIEWTKERKLTWEDFKGIPVNSAETAAVTNCGFGFKSNRINLFRKPVITVSNIFYPQDSWVRPEQKHRKWLLEHEQLHFDISEVYARKLRKELAAVKLNYFNVRSKSEFIFRAVYAAYLLRQKTYEEQTEYSLNTKQQQKWMKQIYSELGQTNQ